MRGFLVFSAVLVALAPINAHAITVWAINQFNTLMSFDSANPSVILTARPMNNVTNAVAIDFRPADGLLYVMNADGRLFKINPNGVQSDNNFAVEPAGTVTNLNGTSFGFDFDPVADRLRITSDTDINLSHQIGGTTAVQTPLSALFGNPCIVGSAYSNNFAGAASTTLYNINAFDNNITRLTTQTPASGGGQVFRAALIDSNGGNIPVVAEEFGFDIGLIPSVGYMAGTRYSTGYSVFSTVNLDTGVVSDFGFIGRGMVIRDIAVEIPEPAGLAMLIILGIASRQRR